MWQLHNAIYKGDWAQREEVVDQCNRLLKEVPLKEYASKWNQYPDLMVHHQIQNLYLPGYSKKVLAYGEINLGLASCISLHLKINKASTFWDLGCGAGSVVVQASLEMGVKILV
jgi:hypothetical protein